MPFKKQGDLWVPDVVTGPLGSLLSAGVWNVNSGGARFVAPRRTELAFVPKINAMKAAGLTHIELHDTDLPTDMTPQEIAQAIRDAGLGVSMVTTNLFRKNDFTCGNYGHPSAAVRLMAIEQTKEFIRQGIEIYNAERYVYWNGSNGVHGRLTNCTMDLVRWTAECVEQIVEWMISEYGWEKAIPFAIEPKRNEPPDQGWPGNVGDVLTVRLLVRESLRAAVGGNPELFHDTLGLIRYALSLGQLAAAGALFYCHLNGGEPFPTWDKDRPFGVGCIDEAVETVYTLQEVGYNGVVAFDVQPLPSDREDQQTESICASVRNFRRFLTICDRIDKDELDSLRQNEDVAGVSEMFVRAITGLD